MSPLKSYRELVAWRKAIGLTKQVYDITKDYPGDERFGLTSQMRRAAVSIPANIAEGHARNTSGEFRQALGVARGSLAEVETMITLSHELGILSAERAEALMASCDEVSRLLAGLIRSLERRGK